MAGAAGSGRGGFRAMLRAVLFGDLEERVARKASLVERQATELAGAGSSRTEESSNRTDDERSAVACLERAILAQRRALDRLAAVRVSKASLEGQQVDGAHSAVRDLSAAAGRAIRMRDRVTPLAERGDEGAKLFHWLDEELLSLLRELEVEVLSDGGEVDPRKHEVVDVRSTGNAEEIDCIATTVRVGYMTGDRVVRAQQVVAFVPAAD